MPLIASTSSGSVSTPAPAGTHVARCVQVIDLGTQKDNGQFGLKIQPKLRLTWELPTELHVFKEENGEEPFVVGKEYTLNLGEKSNLRKDLESWRGKPFTPQELEGFDVSKLLGAPCMLNVVHKPKKDGSGAYANIASLSPLMKGMTCPPAIMALLLYDVSMGRNDVFGKIPEWLRKKIEDCENWKQQAAPEPEPDTNHGGTEGTDLHGDTMPF
jgi:hypothetical protein